MSVVVLLALVGFALVGVVGYLSHLAAKKRREELSALAAQRGWTWTERDDSWAERFEAGWVRIHALDPAKFDERFRRVWRTYLYSCAEMFRSPKGYTHLFQIVFSKGNITHRNYPMSRGFLYEQPAHRQDAGAQRAA